MTFLLTFSAAEAQQKVPLLVPSGEPVSFRDDLVWNKWETDNFIILSLDKQQGSKLKSTVEQLRSDFLNSWGIPVWNSSVKCKLICVPDGQFLSKFFNIKAPHCEVRYDSEGKVSVCAIWIDYNRIGELPSLMGSISVSDSVLPVKMNPVTRQGIASLCSSPESIRSLIGSPVEFDAKALLSTDPNSLTTQKDKDDFRKRSAILCLMLRREFGKRIFSEFLASDQGEDKVKSVLGFSGSEEFSKTLSRYSRNIAEDIEEGKTPDKYIVVH